MSASDLSPDLKAFIFACIDTVEQMELLAVLRHSDAALTAQATGARLGITSAAARHHLEVLTARGLLHVEISPEARYRYDPKAPQLRRYADELVNAYGTSRTLVLRVIAQNGTGSLKHFVNAFKLRRDE